MKLVKINTIAGKEIFVNTDTLISISTDIMNPEYTMIVFGQGLYYTIKMSVLDTIKVLGGK